MKKVIQEKEGTTVVYDNANAGIMFRYLPIRADGTIMTDLKEMRPEVRKSWVNRVCESIEDDSEDL